MTIKEVVTRAVVLPYKELCYALRGERYTA